MKYLLFLVLPILASCSVEKMQSRMLERQEKQMSNMLEQQRQLMDNATRMMDEQMKIAEESMEFMMDSTDFGRQFDQARQADVSKMDSLVGKTQNVVYMAYGIPTEIMSDGGDGQILVYNYYRDQPSLIVDRNQNRTTITEPVQRASY